MTTHNGNPVFRGASGAGAGRGDSPYTRVNAVSAATRKAAPLTKEEDDALTAQGKSAPASYGSQTSYDVSNAGGHAPGQGMSMVRDSYRQQRKAGMTPDQARQHATNRMNYASGSGPGGPAGPTIQQKTDYYGNPV